MVAYTNKILNLKMSKKVDGVSWGWVEDRKVLRFNIGQIKIC